MSEEKFKSEIETILKFIQIFCDDKHNEDKKETSLDITYHDKKIINVNFALCSICKETFLYSVERLQECPREPKPRCRVCPSPCYERPQWKYIAKIMRYSGMKLGLLKIKSFFKRRQA